MLQSSISSSSQVDIAFLGTCESIVVCVKTIAVSASSPLEGRIVSCPLIHIMAFPIIDIADIDNPDAQYNIAKQITEASQTWGFLLLKNHPIPTKDIDRMFSLARGFFVDTPEDQKTPYQINEKYIGYNGPLSDSKKDDKASMWLSGKPGFLSQSTDSLPPYWRGHIDQVESFKHSCHALIIQLLVCFALAMELPDRNFFADAHAEGAGNGNRFRMICYPSRGNKPEKQTTTRMSAHSDSGSVTLLFQTCSGLEVESPTGEWVPAPYIQDHILVNLGDALAFWSGGQLKATKHRVTFEGVPHDVERMTMAYFGAAAPETVLQPIKRSDGTRMEKYEANDVTIYPGITVGEYGDLIMRNIYGIGVARKEVEGRA